MAASASALTRLLRAKAKPAADLLRRLTEPHPEVEHAADRRDAQLLARLLLGFLRPALDIAFCHHERWDGGGYPRGLKGDTIPLSARIVAIVDVWDALRSDRPYRRGWPAARVRQYIGEMPGAHFDPQLVAVFLALIGEPDAEASLDR